MKNRYFLIFTILFFTFIGIVNSQVLPGQEVTSSQIESAPSESQVAGMPAGANIPTLSEWGLIILALLGLSIGIVFIKRKESTLALTDIGQIQNNSTVFDKALYKKTLAITLLIAGAGLALSGIWYGYITATDFIGTIVSSFIVAYMVHLMLLSNHNKSGFHR